MFKQVNSLERGDPAFQRLDLPSELEFERLRELFPLAFKMGQVRIIDENCRTRATEPSG